MLPPPDTADARPSEQAASQGSWRARIPFWVVFAHVAAMVSVYVLTSIPYYGDLLMPVTAVLYVTQVLLVSIWLGVSRRSSVLRVALFPMVSIVFAVSQIPRQFLDATIVREFTLAIGLQMAGIFAMLLLFRCFGHTLEKLTPTEAREERIAPQRFSIRSLVILTVVCAILFTVGRWLSTWVSVQVDGQFSVGQWLLLYLLQSTVYTAIGLSAVWATLGRGRVEVRVTLVPIAAIVTAGALHLIYWEVWPAGPVLYLNVVAIGLAVSGTLYLFRLAGYRFRRCAPDAPRPAETQPAAPPSPTVATGHRDADFDANSYV